MAHSHETHRVRRRPKFHGELEDEKEHKSQRNVVTLEPDVSEVRRVRLDRLDGRSTSKTSRKSTVIPKATPESNATDDPSKSSLSHRRRRRHHTSEEQVQEESSGGRTKSKPSSREEKTRSAYVYGDPKDRAKTRGVTITETRLRNEKDESSDSEDERNPSSSPISPMNEKSKKIKVVYRDQPKVSTSSSRVKADDKISSKKSTDAGTSASRSTKHKSKATAPESVSRPPLSRSATVRIPPPEAIPSSRRNSITSISSTTKNKTAPSVANSATTQTSRKSGGFLSSWFGSGPPPPPPEPEKLVECLTCSDDTPKSKCPKLQCGHRMCHSCLKRIFKLSVKDPQHMPPKCCTAEHIPLKHVEKLFDINFKRLWNKKYQEFTTKNRIYCPAKKCGEWIRPANIHTEGGKKYGLCARCKTKVCGQCNGKWHGTKDCPKDEETNKLLAAAKEAGWQRCYSCRTMVELKEGCNHMTCRCTAQFCMICGLKWKTCNCPWFNYDAVEADRLNHAELPAAQDRGNPVPRPVRLRRQRPANYNEEMNERRRQERQDEQLARRMQGLDVNEDDDQDGMGDIHAVGNNAGHFMNQDYVREASSFLAQPFNHAMAAAGFVMGAVRPRPATNPPVAAMTERFPQVAQAFRQAPAAPAAPAPTRETREQPATPLVRRHTTRESSTRTSRRASEIVVPRKSRTYEAEAAIHAPISRTTSRSSRTAPPRPSILAGLGASGGGNSRVSAWRTHVSPGAPPEVVA